MTSWIIVSSRCVFGSSTGMREFSASSTTKSATAASRQAGCAGAPGRPGQAAPSALGERERAGAGTQTIASARKSAGSASAEKAASRLAPMPSKARAGVERGGHGEEAAEAEQVGEER